MNTDSPAPRPERWWHRHRRLVGGVGALAATALAAYVAFLAALAL